MATTVAELVAKLRADTSDFTRGMAGATSTLNTTAARLESFGSRAVSVGKSMSLGITLPIVALGAVGFKELQEAEKQAAITAAHIKSTGGAANVSAAHIEKMANRLQELSGVDDEVIKSGQNMLLTFKRVRNEAGQGNQIFDRASKAALDLSFQFGSVDGAAKMLGKALADPVAGLTALKKAGVNFSEEQKNTIAALVESGDILGAQKLILQEVESQVGGTAKAYGETMPGALGKAKESFKNSMAQIMVAAAPVLLAVAEMVSRVASAFSSLPGPVQYGVLALLGVLAIAGPVTAAIGGIATALSFLAAHPVVLMIAGVMALVAVMVLFATKWDEIWAWIQANPAIAAVIAAVTMIMLPFVAVAAAIGIFAANWDAIWGWIKQAASDASDWITTAIDDIGAALAPIAGFASAAFHGMLDAINAVAGPIVGMINTIIGAINDVVDALGSITGASISNPGVAKAYKASTKKKKQFGGPVSAGELYQVNEGSNQREFFRPNVSGMILPLGGAGGGGGTPIVIQISGSVVSERQLIDVVREGLRRGDRRGAGSVN